MADLRTDAHRSCGLKGPAGRGAPTCVAKDGDACQTADVRRRGPRLRCKNFNIFRYLECASE